LFVSLLGLGITQPGEFSAAATSQPAGLTSPSNTHVVAVSDSRIDVSWRDNSNNETGFEVHRSIDGSTGTFMLLATTAAGVTARGDLGLNPSTQYCYKVRAFITVNSLASFSDFSNTACATTLPPPPPPGLNVTGVTTGVDLDPDGYWVDVWMDSGGSRIHVTGIGLPANGTVTISGLNPADYQVELSRLAVNCDLTSPNPQPVTLGTSGSAGFAEFDVTCAPVTQLAFSSTVDGNPEIYVINSNGTGSARLTLHPAADVKPAWSPDGAKIAFQSNRDGNAEIHVMNADGSNPVRLTDAAAGNFRPAWSPDGTKIAFTSDRDGNAEIYVMNADGSNPVRLTNDAAYDVEPAWSPDGTKIAFQSDRDGNAELYVMNADGSNPVRLTNHPAADAEPTWSPDGTKIAFTSDRDGNAEIYVMNADGSAVTQLTSVGAAGERHSHPAWYPDGQKIAFVAASCQGTCSSVIQVVRTNGTDLVELTSGADPAWRYPTVPTGISCLFDECPPQFYCGPNGVCVTFCGDGYWNGDEGDVDCGGSCTPRCLSGQHCWVQSDCASGRCINDTCQ